MDESFADPAGAAEPVAADNPIEAPSAPVEQGQGADPAVEAEAHDEGGYLRHADYTRKTQELADQRRAFEAERQAFAEQLAQIERISQDPHLQQQLEAYWSEADNPELDEFVDPFEQKLSELEQRQAAIEQREQQEQFQRVTEQALSADLEEVTKLNGGQELNQQELEILGRFVRPDENGIPRIDIGGWKQLNELFETRRQGWIAGKTQQASTPPSGVQGSAKFDITDETQRINRLAAILSGGN